MALFLPINSNTNITHTVPMVSCSGRILLVRLRGGADLETQHKWSTPGGYNQTWIMAYMVQR